MLNFKNIRIASAVLEEAEHSQIEGWCIVQIGERWLNGEFTDQMAEEHPEIARVLEKLEYQYGEPELMAAFQLLLDCE